MLKLNKLFLYLVAILAFTISSCEDDDDSNPVGSGSSTIDFTVSGDLDLGTLSLPANITDATVGSMTMRAAGASDGTNSITITVNESGEGSFDLPGTMHSISFVNGQESYFADGGTLNITSYTDSKFVGTFDNVTLTSMSSGNEITLTNGSFNITKVTVNLASE
jgi:hypothetical protein